MDYREMPTPRKSLLAPVWGVDMREAIPVESWIGRLMRNSLVVGTVLAVILPALIVMAIAYLLS